MLKKVLCAAVGSAIAVCAYAESNVTLYGVLDTAVTVTKHENQSAKSHDGRRYLRRKPFRLLRVPKT